MDGGLNAGLGRRGFALKMFTFNPAVGERT